MCNYVSLLSEAQELEEYFDASYKGEPYHKEYRVNGFAHPQLPVILDEDPSQIITMEWGLIPHWAKNRDFQKMTLNARIETLDTTASYRDVVNQRCVVLADGFFEWQWKDEKGKVKQPYYIKLKDRPFIALGALYSQWKDPETSKTLNTFSIVTTGANKLMEQIHNTKKRMPLVLDKTNLYRWLDDNPTKNFAFPSYDPVLEASAIEK